MFQATVLRGHYAKYRSLMPSIALIIDLLENFEDLPTAVSQSSVKKAISWCEKLKGHARKIYGEIVDKNVATVHVLAERIKTGRFIDGMKLRDVARKNWPLLRTSDQIEDACEVLEKLNWIRRERRKTPGGTSTLIYLNPELIKS